MRVIDIHGARALVEFNYLRIISRLISELVHFNIRWLAIRGLLLADVQTVLLNTRSVVSRNGAHSE